MRIDLNVPNLSKLEKKILIQALSKNEISTYGSNVKKLETNLINYTGTKYNLAVNSGSSALYLAFVSAGLKKNDIVIMPSYTFAATANSIYHAGGKPWFFDIDKETFCIDIDQIEQALSKKTYQFENNCYLKKNKQRIFGITPVFTFGLLPNLKKLKQISKKYNLKIISDAACALGSKFQNKNHTNFTDISIFSLNGNKSVTAGGGGIISTNTKKIFLKARSLSTNCKLKDYNYEDIGFNLRITNLHASIALAQLKRFKSIYFNKKRISKIYEKKLSNYEFLPKNSWCKNMLWFNTIILKNKFHLNRIIKVLNNKKISASFFWKPLHLQKPYKNFKKKKLNFTNEIWKKILVLPSSSNISDKDLFCTIKLLNKNNYNE